MIQIDNLTQYQVEMLDMMWSLETEEDYTTWYSLLDEPDQKLADTLQRLVILESFDQLVDATEYKDAKKILNRIALQR